MTAIFWFDPAALARRRASPFPWWEGWPGVGRVYLGHNPG